MKKKKMSCAICLESRDEFEAEGRVAVTVCFCGHWFCSVCFFEWFETNENCPICRCIPEYYELLGVLYRVPTVVIGSGRGQQIEEIVPPNSIIRIISHSGRGRGTRYLCVHTNGSRTWELGSAIGVHHGQLLNQYRNWLRVERALRVFNN